MANVCFGVESRHLASSVDERPRQEHGLLRRRGRMLMKLSRQWGARAREQNWFAIALDFVIVIVGVFLGIQAANWNEARQDRTQERRYYAQIIEDLRRDQLILKGAQRRAG